MSKRWYQENRRDPWRRQAKSKGYRSRSAFKLKQIHERFEIIRVGDAILDVGCHPRRLDTGLCGGVWGGRASRRSGPQIDLARRRGRASCRAISA